MQARRHQYLKAMGIQVWQLRDRLAAGESIADVEFSIAIEQPQQTDESLPSEAGRVAPAAVDSNEVAAADSGRQDQSLTQPIQQQTPQTQSQQPPRTQQAPKSTPVNSEESNPEFRLASIIFPGNCLVVTQVSMTSADPFSHSQLMLLKNILQAVGLSMQEEPLLTFFNWPMLRSPGFDRSETAARQACQAFLNGQKSKHSLSFVLLMGEETGRYLMANEESFTSARGQLLTELIPPVLLTEGIDQLIAEPGRKALLWRDIQPLKQRLEQAGV